MTVQMLRDAGAEVETGSRGRGGTGGGRSVPDMWRVHPGVLAPGAITVRAGPVQRRAVPRRRAGDGGHGDGSWLAAADLAAGRADPGRADSDGRRRARRHPAACG